MSSSDPYGEEQDERKKKKSSQKSTAADKRSKYMITKFNKYDKVFESLPRQSTVDQLHKIRDEIKKFQVIKVGPDESSISGDIGDRVMQDLKKHQMNNLFFSDNPFDRYIDSYETFVQDGSRDSLGYTKKGDPKKHKVKKSKQRV